MPGEGTKRQQEPNTSQPIGQDEKEKKRILEADVDPGGDTTDGQNFDGQEDIVTGDGRGPASDSHPDSTGTPAPTSRRTRNDQTEDPG
jgi:hypothetical protein